MPDTSKTSHGCRSCCTSAFFTEARMPKSPHPAHQVGFSAMLNSLRSDICHDSFSDLLGQLVSHEHAPVVLQDLVFDVDAGLHSDDLRQLAGVVVFDVDHPLGVPEQALGRL